MTDEEIRKDIDERVEKAIKRGICDRVDALNLYVPNVRPVEPEDLISVFYKEEIRHHSNAARAMLIEYRKAVLEENEYANALSALLYYRQHSNECEVGNTEFCTCGMKHVADVARQLLRKRALAAVV